MENKLRKKGKEEKISIIIPIYNGEDCIKGAIESVLVQTYKNWEMIIVDDGSKDHTSEIIKPYLTDKRIKYIFQENKGVAGARNTGLKKAKGNYIVLLDGDDKIMPDFFKSAIEKFKIFEKEKIDIKTIYYTCIDESGNKLYHLPFKEILVTLKQFLVLIKIYDNEYIFMKKRNFIDEGFLFDEDIDTPGVRHLREFKKWPLVCIINKSMRVFTQNYGGRLTMSINKKRLALEIKGKERFLKENGRLFLKYNKNNYLKTLKIIIFSSGLLGEYRKNLRYIIKMIKINKKNFIIYLILLLFSLLFGKYFYHFLYRIFIVIKKRNANIKKKLLW